MINFNNKSIAIYADEAFSIEYRKKFPVRAKCADGLIRYSNNFKIKAIVDTTFSSNEKLFKDIKCVKSIEEIENDYIDIFVIGVSPAGGRISENIRKDVITALERGMDIVSGMHYELNKDIEISALAKKNNCEIWDVRNPIGDFDVASARCLNFGKPILLTCASDAAIGKMTTGFEIERYLNEKGIKGELIATGQNAIMIKGKGISIDRVIGDFMPGAVEKLVIESDESNKFVILEGQGGICHPGFSSVTLALLHGGLPTHLILIDKPIRKHSIGSKDISLPSAKETMEIYEKLALRKIKWIGISVNSQGLDDKTAKEYILRLKEITKVPVEDMIRFQTGELGESAMKHINEFYEK